jgi:hypothetical protein
MNASTPGPAAGRGAAHGAPAGTAIRRIGLVLTAPVLHAAAQGFLEVGVVRVAGTNVMRPFPRIPGNPGHSA